MEQAAKYHLHQEMRILRTGQDRCQGWRIGIYALGWIG